jgi:DNA-directed RNA polymerase specialized sigma24 family protein
VLSSRSVSHWIGQLRARDQVAAQVNEEWQRLLESLRDRDLRAIAVWKIEGYTTEEIAAKLRRAPRTVESKLDLIRRRWIA